MWRKSGQEHRQAADSTHPGSVKLAGLPSLWDLMLGNLKDLQYGENTVEA